MSNTNTEPIIATGHKPGRLDRTAARAMLRLEEMPDSNAGRGWNARAARDLTIFGICQAGADTLRYIRGKAERK